MDLSPTAFTWTWPAQMGRGPVLRLGDVTGYHLMPSSQVTPEMTEWAMSILRGLRQQQPPYPRWPVFDRTFGTLAVRARLDQEGTRELIRFALDLYVRDGASQHP